MSDFVVSVDPGVHLMGVALWLAGQLRRAELIKFTDPLESGKRLQQWINLNSAWDLVIEKPQVYARSKSKGDPNDLIDLAMVVGMATSVCKNKVTVYKPAEWKGQIKKPTRKNEPYPVEERCRVRLTLKELANIVLPRPWRQKMDVWDAVGIGLRHLKNEGLRT